jgi:hypothetical protein
MLKYRIWAAVGLFAVPASLLPGESARTPWLIVGWTAVAFAMVTVDLRTSARRRR